MEKKKNSNEKYVCHKIAHASLESVVSHRLCDFLPDRFVKLDATYFTYFKNINLNDIYIIEQKLIILIVGGLRNLNHEDNPTIFQEVGTNIKNPLTVKTKL